MELNKKNYNAKEVSKYLNEVEAEYREKLLLQKNKIDDLVAENNRLKSQVAEYNEKLNYIDNAVIKTQKDSLVFQEKSLNQYKLTVEKLKSFYLKWNLYFKSLSEKYPNYEEVKKANGLMQKIKTLFTKTDCVKVVDEIIETMNKTKVDVKGFNPKQKINDYVVATSESGFNLDEVLNPGEIKLEDICKELGLIED